MARAVADAQVAGCWDCVNICTFVLLVKQVKWSNLVAREVDNLVAKVADVEDGVDYYRPPQHVRENPHVRLL